MPIVSVETSKYITDQQNYLAKTKLGQFSKFLNKNPIFVTYFVINKAQSRTDAGTGSIYEQIGTNSPVRYNKVLQLPAYNLPELKPDVVNDEGGYDIDMDITDIAFLPSTIQPKPGDCMRVDIEGVKPLLYQCNAYRHNTIQSNDFYQGDFNLLDIEQEYLDAIESQVEETYTCKFENIGTNNKVFLTQKDEDDLNNCQELINALTTFYNDAFYNVEIDGFVLYGCDAYTENSDLHWYCDNYLTKFINESEIFVNESSDTTVVLPYLDLLPLNFNFTFGRTLWNAVLEKTKDYLNIFTYAWTDLVKKRTSPLMMSTIPSCHPSIMLYDHEMHENESNQIVYPYFSLALMKSISTNKQDPSLNIIEQIIFQYVSNGIQNVEYTKDTLLNFAFKHDLFTYMHMPIIIYILKMKLNYIASSK